MLLTLAARRAIRAHAGLPFRDSAPVRIVAGRTPPRERGRSYYWTTPSGRTVVHHPNAYGWPTLYHPSTRHVEVGDRWLAALAAVDFREPFIIPED